MFLGLFIDNQKNQRNIKNRLTKSKKYFVGGEFYINNFLVFQ